MQSYESFHPPDKTCNKCLHYDYHDREDSFGPVRDEYCDKGHYGHVGYFSEACEDYEEED